MPCVSIWDQVRGGLPSIWVETEFGRHSKARLSHSPRLGPISLPARRTRSASRVVAGGPTSPFCGLFHSRLLSLAGCVWFNRPACLSSCSRTRLGGPGGQPGKGSAPVGVTSAVHGCQSFLIPMATTSGSPRWNNRSRTAMGYKLLFHYCTNRSRSRHQDPEIVPARLSQTPQRL